MKSIWMDTTAIQKRNPLKGDIDAEVVIIGAGLAGILTGYMLKQKGIDAVILEAGRIGSGQTGRTTAKITSQHGLIYQDLIQIYGREKAKHYAGFQEWAVRQYEKIIQEQNISCDFVHCNANLYSCKSSEALKREAEAAIDIGIQAVYMKKCELPFPVKGVLSYENQARFHPLKFINGIEKELHIFEETKVKKVIAEDTGKSLVLTERGTVTAGKVVFTCHFPFMNIPGYYFARMYQSRSYVTALKGAGQFDGYYLGIDEGGFSFRNEGELLLFGGEGHRTGDHPPDDMTTREEQKRQESEKELDERRKQEESDGAYQRLSKKAEEFWPGCEETVRWSAQDCMTLDGIPYIGEYSGRENGWYVATGFGKWGMTSSMAAARIISSLIEGIIVPEADIFSPQRRIPGEGLKKFFSNQGTAVKNLTSTKQTKRCSHMGCKLSWNPEEGTWDCPCHGSRFTRDGEVLDGPAVKALT